MEVIPELSAHHRVDDGVEHAVGLGKHGWDQCDHRRKRGGRPGAAGHWVYSLAQRATENITGTCDGVVVDFF